MSELVCLDTSGTNCIYGSVYILYDIVHIVLAAMDRIGHSPRVERLQTASTSVSLSLFEVTLVYWPADLASAHARAFIHCYVNGESDTAVHGSIPAAKTNYFLFIEHPIPIREHFS